MHESKSTSPWTTTLVEPTTHELSLRFRRVPPTP